MPRQTIPTRSAKPRVFVDADVLFAGCAASSQYGASLVVLRMAEITLVEAFASPQVIDEVERNLSAKLPKVLPAFHLVVARCLQIVPEPDAASLTAYTGLADPGDLPILAAAHLSECPYLVSFNLRHYYPGHPRVIVLSPGDFLLRVRDLLTRLG